MRECIIDMNDNSTRPRARSLGVARVKEGKGDTQERLHRIFFCHMLRPTVVFDILRLCLYVLESRRRLANIDMSPPCSRSVQSCAHS